MINQLSNILIYILIPVTYAAVIIFISIKTRLIHKYAGFQIPKSVLDNLNKLTFIKKIFYGIYLAASKFHHKITIPFKNLCLKILNKLSLVIISSEEIASNNISAGMRESITEFSLIFRKYAESNIRAIWSVMFLFFVIIYFILTLA